MNMYFAKLIFSIALVAAKLSAVYCSILFDKVEFYNSNKTLDESTSNWFVCAHLGEGCQITAQCCGVATCALPSWSETPICLVPGYKHDERFRKRFFSLHNLQPGDIRYIRDSYNTSQYDFLLTDLTFSAPPLDKVENTSSSEVVAANVTVTNDTVDVVGDLGRNISVDSNSSEDVAENSQITNDSLEKSYETNSSIFIVHENLERGLNNSTGSVLQVSVLDDSALNNRNRSRIYSTNLSKTDDFDLKNRFMFLLINNTLGQSDYKLDMKEFYDQITDTDRFKNIVEQLREKMREINEMENNPSNNNTENPTAFRYSSKETDKPTTEKSKTTQKISKWDVVKKFLFHDKESPNDNHNFTIKNNTNHLKGIVDKIRSKETHKVSSKENISGKGVIQTNYPDNPSDDRFKKIFEDVDKIEEIIDSDRTINTFHGSKNINDEGLFDFYNINLPLSSFDGATEKTEGMNNSLENVLKDIGDTINSMIITNNGNGESEQNDLEMKKDSNLLQFSKKYSLNQCTSAKDERTSNETHFWDKIHFWRVPRNLSAEMENSFRKLFFRKEESSASEKQNKLTPLNEYFLLNLNSKKTQETETPLKAEQIEQTSEYSSYMSSSESESSGTEELYNNSYVFMVHKEQFEEPVKVSSWKRVMNFFHREKDVPPSLDLNINDLPGRISFDSKSHPSKIEYESNPNIVDVPEIIRLPEYLMPQALDERQGNETDWIFEDSEDLEDKIIEEHKSSNSSFFFFFK